MKVIEEAMEKLYQMKLRGMASGLKKALEEPAWQQLSFPEKFSLIVQEQWQEREERALHRRLKEAMLPQKARLEEVIVKDSRGLSRQLFVQLSLCQWLKSYQNILITGLTGTGKTYIASALGERACRERRRVRYWRCSLLLEELKISHKEGKWIKLLDKTERYDVLILDDWGFWELTEAGRRDLLEVIDNRAGLKTTILASQVPISSWHELLGSDNIADAILDRLIHGSIRIELKGESMRKILSEGQRT